MRVRNPPEDGDGRIAMGDLREPPVTASTGNLCPGSAGVNPTTFGSQRDLSSPVHRCPVALSFVYLSQAARRSTGYGRRLELASTRTASKAFQVEHSS